ncbi:class I SAM-dependent methyltransferase [Leucobacter sp. M11]|uniref:class I SAM-dependent methyltransferase n=1 Tax=Leucobacter sp. M11 TaxID=2993565 RepID=UPI002D7F87A2|nr:methyltransferase [Leucobacter sp. M11]MEB4615907.1 methyltransferase [Leucobacter sp. M11]
MSSDHYFTPDPGSDFTPREVRVRLAGEERTLVTAGGVFSPEHLDAGTAALLRFAPEPPETGEILDLGCGWGPIALEAALESPEARVWALDVNERARELTRRNAQKLGLTNLRVVDAAEIPAELRFASIRSNPPIRVGKEVLHGLLETWLPRLAPGGVAHLVVAKHLGAESLQRWIEETFGPRLTVERIANHKGFRILEVRDGSAAG